MKVEFRKSFEKDLKTIKDTKLLKKIKSVIEEIEKADNLQQINQIKSLKGSHRKWRNNELGLQVTVLEHRGNILPIGTLRNILIMAKIPESEWIQ